MKLARAVGSTSEIWQIFVRDSSSTTGAGLTGLAFNTASLVAYYHRDTDVTATAISLVTMTRGTFASGGFVEIDATNMPGWYQFCPPNAALATGAKSVGIHLKGATNMAPLPIEVDLDAQVDVTKWLGTATSATVAGTPNVNTNLWLGGAIPAVAVTGVPIVDAGYWKSQVIPTPNQTGVPKTDLLYINGTAVTTSTTPIDVNLVSVNSTNVTCTFPTTGIVSNQADVRGAVDNVNVTVDVPPVFNRPSSNQRAVRFTAMIHSYTGAMAAGDSAPVVDVVNQDGTSKNDRLQDSAGSPTTTMVSTATGEYELYYLVTSADALDNLRFRITTVKNSITKQWDIVAQIVSESVSASTLWGSALPGAFSAGTAGYILGTNLDTTVSSRASPTNITAGTITTVTNLTNLPSIPTGWITAAGIASGALVGGVWDATTGGHVGAGTFGGLLNSASAGGDPWSTSLPGSYTGGTAGYILGTNLDAAISTRPTLAQIMSGGDVDGYSLEQTLKLCLAALAGKLSGAGTTTITIRSADDTQNRITATVDSSGNRTAITLNTAG